MSLLFLDREIDANDVFGSLWPHTSDFQNPAAATCPAVSQATARSTRAFVVCPCNTHTIDSTRRMQNLVNKTIAKQTYIRACKQSKHNKGGCSYVPKMYGFEPVASSHFETAFG